MCVVIDTNCLSRVFCADNSDHLEFLPIKNWIECEEGRIVYGGSKYREELLRAPSYLNLLVQYGKARKTVLIKDNVVDKYEKEVSEKLGKETKCDDQHIIALLIASKCPLLCSVDERSFEFVKNPSLYPKKFRRPKIYSSSRNSDLLKKTGVNLKDIKNKT